MRGSATFTREHSTYIHGIVERNVSSGVGNSLSTIRRIARTEGGAKAFYRGLTPNLVGNSTSWACYFVWYENIKRALEGFKEANISLSYYDYFVASACAGKIEEGNLMIQSC